MSLAIGLFWGIVPFTGASGILGFGILNVLIPFLYYTKFLHIDEESYGRLDLIQEGFGPSFGLFLVSW